MYVCMYVCMYLYVCMYVYIYIYIYRCKVRTAEAPLERIKLLLQNQNMATGHKPYWGKKGKSLVRGNPV